MSLYLGCPIWAFKGWVGNFFPKGTKSADFLCEYSQRLTTVEGNTTFYAVPSLETIQHWVEETPTSFRFCPKLPRTISHGRKLAEHIGEARAFLEVMSQLGSRLGPLFLQLPPRYSPAMVEDLRSFLEAWPGNQPLAVEARHLDWFDSPHLEAFLFLLEEKKLARVVIDTRPIRSLRDDSILTGSIYLRLLQARERKPDVPVLPERTADFVFLRYIGHPQLELNAPFINEWATHLVKWLREGVEAYVFCHCPDERLDPWLCQEFHQRIAESLPIPPLPWDQADENTTQQARLL